eukprot:6175092-Pleurochrysis_carterae.AAC.1
MAPLSPAPHCGAIMRGAAVSGAAGARRTPSPAPYWMLPCSAGVHASRTRATMSRGGGFRFA